MNWVGKSIPMHVMLSGMCDTCKEFLISHPAGNQNFTLRASAGRASHESISDAPGNKQAIVFVKKIPGVQLRVPWPKPLAMMPT